MRGINKVILVGTLGQDPEVRYTQHQTCITSISIATSEKWKDKNTGEQKEKTEWHRVSIFGKAAEVAGEYLKKGSQVYIEGQLETQKWKDQQGNDRYTTIVAVKPFKGSMQLLGSKPQQQQQSWGQPQQPAPQQQQQPVQQQQQNQAPVQQNQQWGAPQQQSAQTMDYPDFDDDIPF